MRKAGGLIADIIRQADLVLLALCVVTSGFGLVMVASATHYMTSGATRMLLVQGCAIVLGIGVYFLVSMVDFQAILKHWKWLAVFNVGFFLLLKTPLGYAANNNLAWLSIPGFPVKIQPAEIVKLTFIILFAYQLTVQKEKMGLKSFKSVALLAGHLLGLIGLYYVISGDMGSALVYAFIFACMCFTAGVALRWFVLGGSGAAIAFYLLWNEDKIPEYMKMRFRVLFDHSLAPLDEGWQQTRSLLALGGGRLLGQGLFQGTQTQSIYDGSLPYRYTDFIFSVIGEELGLVGCLAAVILLCAIIGRCLTVAMSAKTKLESYICVGVAGTLIFQMVSNIGMCLYVLPVIGLTLPFFSYGGSSIVTLFAAMGMVSGIHKRSLPEWLR